MNRSAEATWKTAELSQVLGISAQRIGVLQKEGRLPRQTNGVHNVKAVVRAYIELLKHRESTGARNKAVTRKLGLDNALRTVRLRRLCAALVPVDRVEKDWFQASRNVRDALQNLPARLSGPFAAETSQAKIFDVFSSEIREVLQALAQGHDGQQTKGKKQAVGIETDSGSVGRVTSARRRDRATRRHTGFPGKGYADGDGEECSTDQEDSSEDD